MLADAAATLHTHSNREIATMNALAVIGLGYVGLPLEPRDDLPRADAIVAAVAHNEFAPLSVEDLGCRGGVSPVIVVIRRSRHPQS